MHSHTGDLGEAVGGLLIEIKIKRAKEELLLLNLRSTTSTTTSTRRTNNSNGSKLMHTSPSTSTSTNDRMRTSIIPPPAFRRVVFNTGLHREPCRGAQSNNDENNEEQDNGDNVEQDEDLKLNEVLAKEIELVA
ncbi:hypothetical protein BDZ89DRAFT_1051776 [Hymenopellis radicata]|nr:hypothetical protein BDZ89DRAFT_1051776 [Hymenopellis radicata]